MPCLTESVTTPAHTRSLNHQASLSLHSRGSAQAQTLHMKNRTCARRSRTSSASIVSPGGVINKKLHTLLHRMPMHAPSPLETTACVTQTPRASFISLPPHLCCCCCCSFSHATLPWGVPSAGSPLQKALRRALLPLLPLLRFFCRRLFVIVFCTCCSCCSVPPVSPPLRAFAHRPIRRAPPPRRSEAGDRRRRLRPHPPLRA